MINHYNITLLSQFKVVSQKSISSKYSLKIIMIIIVIIIGESFPSVANSNEITGSFHIIIIVHVIIKLFIL